MAQGRVNLSAPDEGRFGRTRPEGMTPFIFAFVGQHSNYQGGFCRPLFYPFLLSSERETRKTGISPTATMMTAGTPASSTFARDASS